MPASLDIVNQVDRLRVGVGCESRGDFIQIARALGIQISAAEYSRAMNDQKNPDRQIWERLLDIGHRMAELQASIGEIPVDWSKTDAVSVALTTRLVSRIVNELGVEQSETFSQLADEATSMVKKYAVEVKL